VGEGVPPSDDENLYVYCEPRQSSGINTSVIDDNAPEEYYTITGMRVDAHNLTPGIYIVRNGQYIEKRYIH
ncbi:MAG: hypothetical protein K2M61_08980, partial [Muribaculaceae bacterium]|nr:hypothetical protein [Muribaculaceae bacterium]